MARCGAAAHAAPPGLREHVTARLRAAARRRCCRRARRPRQRAGGRRPLRRRHRAAAAARCRRRRRWCRRRRRSRRLPQSLAAPSYQLALQRGAGGADAPVAPPTILQLESYLEYLEPAASDADAAGGDNADAADDAGSDGASGGGASALPPLLPTVLKLVRPPQRDSGGDGEETLRNATLTLRAAEAGCVLLRAAGPRSTPPEPLVAAIGKGLRAARSQMSQALPAWGQYAGQKLWAAPATAELLLALTAYLRAAAALCTPRWCEERDDGWRDKLLGSLNDQLKTVAWGLSVLAASARERNERAERAATAVAADFAAAAVARPRLATLDSQDDWMADEPQGGGEEGGGGSGGGSGGPTEEEMQVEAEAAARRAALGALIAWLPLLPAAALLKGDTRQLLSDGLACACNHAAIDTPTRLATLSAMAALVRRCDAIPAAAPQAAAGGGSAIVPMEVEGASRSSTAELSRWVEVAHSFFHPLGDAAKSGDDAALCAALDAAAAFASRGPSMVARRGCVLELRSYGELLGHVLKSCASRGCFGPPPKIDRHPLQPRTRLLLVVALRAHLGLRDALESLRRHDRDADGDATGDGAPYSGLPKLEELNEVIKEETIENLLMTALGDAHGAVRAAAVDALPALIGSSGEEWHSLLFEDAMHNLFGPYDSTPPPTSAAENEASKTRFGIPATVLRLLKAHVAAKPLPLPPGAADDGPPPPPPLSTSPSFEAGLDGMRAIAHLATHSGVCRDHALLLLLVAHGPRRRRRRRPGACRVDVRGVAARVAAAGGGGGAAARRPRRRRG